MKKILGITALTFFFAWPMIATAEEAGGAGAALDGQAIFARSCAGCHGDGATGATGPALKGQSAAELMEKLNGYRDGNYGGGRKNVMEGVVKKHQPEELQAVGKYIGSL